MNVLIIEDNPTYLEGLEAALSGIGITDRSVAVNLGSAKEKIETAQPDVIICDLKIPASDGLLDPEVEHGLAAYNYAVTEKPGTPVIILSGFGTLEIVSSLLRKVQTGDVFGTGVATPMAVFFKKDDLSPFLKHLDEIQSEIAALENIEIVTPREDIELDHYEKRILRIIARGVGGVLVKVSEIGTGLSGTRTLPLEALDGNGQVCARDIAKIGHLEAIADESNRYDRHVAHVLAQGDYAPKVSEVTAGAGNLGAVVYRLADGYDSNIFDLLGSDVAKSVSALETLRAQLQPWSDGAALKETDIRDIRRARINDENFDKVKHLLDGIDFEGFESRKIYVRECRQHGDLHGLNALVNSESKPLLIDYGEVGQGCLSFDALTLELSLLFHPEGKAIRGDWPDADAAKVWNNCDAYVEKCPVPDFVKGCRKWATDGPTPREVLANAYAYLVRQLQYQDTDHGLAVLLIRTIIDSFQ